MVAKGGSKLFLLILIGIVCLSFVSAGIIDDVTNFFRDLFRPEPVLYAPGDCNDTDGDGYNQSMPGCGVVDCNDTNSGINPGAPEVICDGIDQNCSGSDDCPCFDTDLDGYGDPASPGCIFSQLDCNDSEEDVLLRYIIKDEEGNQILSNSETVAVGTTGELFKTFEIPEDLEEGRYVFYTQVDYQGKVASSSILFNVSKGIPTFVIVLIISLFVGGVVIFIVLYKVKKGSKDGIEGGF